MCSSKHVKELCQLYQRQYTRAYAVTEILGRPKLHSDRDWILSMLTHRSNSLRKETFRHNASLIKWQHTTITTEYIHKKNVKQIKPGNLHRKNNQSRLNNGETWPRWTSSSPLTIRSWSFASLVTLHDTEASDREKGKEQRINSCLVMCNTKGCGQYH